MTDKERMELLNLRKRCEAQREEIKRLQERTALIPKVSRLAETGEKPETAPEVVSVPRWQPSAEEYARVLEENVRLKRKLADVEMRLELCLEFLGETEAE